MAAVPDPAVWPGPVAAALDCVVLGSGETELPPDCHLLADEHAPRTLLRFGLRIEQVLRELVADKSVTTVLVEAGGQFTGRLVDEGWVDVVGFRIWLYGNGSSPHS